MSDWARLEDAIIAANFWMLDESGGHRGCGGADWMVAGRRRHDYHFVRRWSPGGALFDLGRLLFDVTGWERFGCSGAPAALCNRVLHAVVPSAGSRVEVVASGAASHGCGSCQASRSRKTSIEGEREAEFARGYPAPLAEARRLLNRPRENTRKFLEIFRAGSCSKHRRCRR
jgi:hypothetical protein